MYLHRRYEEVLEEAVVSSKDVLELVGHSCVPIIIIIIKKGRQCKAERE